MAQIIPGVLTGDGADYRERLKKAEHAADLVQIDIIDGKFAPNTTIGVDTIRKYPSKCLLEVQLMVQSPRKFIEQLSGLDFVSRVIFPFETKGVADNIYLVKKFGMQVGLSVNPETKVEEIIDFSAEIDVLCIFSASPGFSGKKLEPAVYGRIQEAKELYRDLPVEVDIGVNFETAPKLAAAGADFLVATSALCDSEDYFSAYNRLAKLADSAR